MSFDTQILFWIDANLHNKFTDMLFPAITGLGDIGIFWIICTIAMLCMKKTRKHGVLMAVALVLAACLGNLALKPLLNRPRPFTEFPNIKLLIPPETSSSFPSAHTMSSFACAAVFWYYDRRWGIGAMILASLIGFSRLFLFVHYPTDVLSGMFLGLFVGFVVCMAGGKVKIGK